MTAFWPIGTVQAIRIISYPIRKKSRFWLFCMWSVKELYHALLPKTNYRDKGRGHDRRLGVILLFSQPIVWVVEWGAVWPKFFKVCAKIVLRYFNVIPMSSQCYPNVLSNSQMLESSVGYMMIVNHVNILMRCTLALDPGPYHC